MHYGDEKLKKIATPTLFSTLYNIIIIENKKARTQKALEILRT